jgi:hypothetical protein
MKNSNGVPTYREFHHGVPPAKGHHGVPPRLD